MVRRDINCRVGLADGQRAVDEVCGRKVVIGRTEAAHRWRDGVGSMIDSSNGAAGEASRAANDATILTVNEATHLGGEAGEGVAIVTLGLIVGRDRQVYFADRQRSCA